MRHNLSGVYIFDKLEGDEKRQPTCFEDCSEETQDKWLKSLRKEAVVNLAKHLGVCLREIGDAFDLVEK